MRISAKADYAIRALVELAADAQRPLVCEGIAAAQHIPYRFLKSVMRDLRRTGLVRSQRGCEGGYWLGRAAATITLADVVAAVDGELMTVHGERPGDATTAPGVTAVWRAIQARTEEILVGVTIADLLTATPAEPAATLLDTTGGEGRHGRPLARAAAAHQG
ncbi:RrF2 family transcriptional regulator [Dactylosporangium sp. NPDC000521]|uniref:RrF2 family transcriptional regulator n=1 Tax=Dactylosporangium sp. NPDC000521 TaxID=3363975 RepID=UPI0036A06494